MNKLKPKCGGFVCLHNCIDEFKPMFEPNPVETILLQYRYEVFSSFDVILSEELKEIEHKILTTLSHKKSLISDSGDDCILDNVTSTESEIVVSLASSPTDRVDTEDNVCVNDPPTDMSCTPIKGKMVVKYASLGNNANAELDVSRDMLNLLYAGMDGNEFVTENIERLKFVNGTSEVGDGHNLSWGDVSTGDTLGGNQPTGFAATLAISTATVVALLVLGSAFLAKRKFRKSEEEAKKDTLSPQSTDDEKFDDYMDDSAVCENYQNYEDDDDDGQSVMNPAKARYQDDGTFLQSKKVALSTISEVSEETDTSAINSNRGSPSGSSIKSEPFSRILSDSIYIDESYV